MRVYFDANVMFAAAYNPRGTPRQVIDKVLQQGWLAITSDYAWAEAERNILRKARKKAIHLDDLHRLIHIWSDVDDMNEDIELKAKDIPIFRAALYHRCSLLITGDLKDFSPLMADSYRRLIQVLTPRQALTMMENKQL
ncbi:PIN domain-containing protein [Pseudobacteriovorax antillogorgiicola]|uniref:Predicted nucleic acid-binding protein, contains PIN domain n=1 Tax=Pseudobacteriovorax antillogorgiicola TaxID=1513793 RepID=A0A1Y6CJD6_9BACT|nr:PIN domain-containing protein [Pseudobacteriovorax antillogorgiicola]TCS46369.1 putative nucleic acid-binding protein [Pseudobacteriovorax antillogorgiicola]SMF68515.1 Predicted nucleic acid-binding protein, contains PIN domain [Pseudobacteriovorax antillogorgiicola]